MNECREIKGFVFIVDGYNKGMKYGKMYFKMMKEEWDPVKQKEDQKVLRSMSLDIQSAAISVASPRYTPAKSNWTKLQSAVALKSLMKENKKEK